MSQWSEDIISEEQAGTLDGLFSERTRRSPDDEAYRAYDRHGKAWVSYSWREMRDRVGQWQAALRSESLKPGDRVGIQLLYVDGGWEFVGGHHLSHAGRRQDGRVLLSNRAEWVVTSDSKGRPRLDPLPVPGKARGADSSPGRDTPEG